MTNAAATLDPQEIQQKWLELAPLIDRLMERVDTQGEFAVEARSSLAADDRAAAPFHVSHVLAQCLSAGVDHMHAAKTLVVDQQVLHLAAPSSLARGALENFATAYWILGPRKRQTRVERALRWHYRNHADQYKALTTANADMKNRAARLARIDEATVRNGLDLKSLRRGYTSTETVRFCDESIEHSQIPLGVELPWQICSGFAHGRLWAYLGVSERQVVADNGDGTLELRLTGTLASALYPMLAAMELLEVFLRLRKQQSTRHV